MANRVFEDRVGLWIVDPARGRSRLPAIKAFGGGLIKDTFWPESSAPADLKAARAAGLYAHVWVDVAGRSAEQLGDDAVAAVTRLGAGALELNIELASDAALAPFVVATLKEVRARRKNLRVRVNLGAWKGFGAPAAELVADPHLYCCEQTYLGDMTRVSEGDVYHDLLGYGVPEAKLTLCYGAAGPLPPQHARGRTLPELGRRRRGVIFTDDLMADVGLL